MKSLVEDRLNPNIFTQSSSATKVSTSAAAIKFIGYWNVNTYQFQHFYVQQNQSW